MIVFLTSSPTGPLDGSRRVEGLDEMNSFRENLRKYWRPQSKCLMITASPDAYESNDQMTGFFENAVRMSGFSVSEFRLLDGRSDEFSREELHSYDVIFLGGGHVPTQRRFFDSIQLRDKIQGFDGIVIGISAGTMNCARVVYAQPEEEGESIDPEYERFFPGLGLTEVQILPHYQMVRSFWLDGRRLIEDITFGDSYGNRFLALEDGSYFLSENGKESIWGNAYWISNGQINALYGQVNRN